MVRVEFSERIKAGDPDPGYAVIAARHGQGWLCKALQTSDMGDACRAY